MKPDWDALAKEYESSTTVIVADVDCTAGGKDLCDKYGVKGYPTIKTFRQGHTEGEAYEGDRSPEALRKHVETLGPACGLENKDLCSPEQLAQLEKFAAMSQERRTGEAQQAEECNHEAGGVARGAAKGPSVAIRPVAEARAGAEGRVRPAN